MVVLVYDFTDFALLLPFSAKSNYCKRSAGTFLLLPKFGKQKKRPRASSFFICQFFFQRNCERMPGEYRTFDAYRHFGDVF